MEYKIDSLAKGTRIISGDEAKLRRYILNIMIQSVEHEGFNEIILPVMEKSELYTDKAGAEILDQMYTFIDKNLKKKRSLCLRPEGTATIQKLADTHFKAQKDVKFWYFTRCYRYERPQAGRYREFFQFGVEWINPSDVFEAQKQLGYIAHNIMSEVGIIPGRFAWNESAKRGLNYYTKDGFEMSAHELGAQQQILGGGQYKQGVGFAFGFDRLMLLIKNNENVKRDSKG